jgi:glyoxylase-like metal-dependent hydrolase (beta-lactamase superfamily II)
VSQLAAAGVSAEQINWVVISHLHPDHAGMIDSFPKATVIVDQREWDAQKAKHAKKKNSAEFDPADYEGKLNLQLVDLSSAPAYGAFDHGLDLFKDGTMFLIDLSGHTPGSIGLWVSLDDSPVLLAGDASWILDNHQDLALPIKTSIGNVDSYWRRLYQMRAMQEELPRLVIFPGHDLLPLRLQPRPAVEGVPYVPPASTKR